MMRVAYVCADPGVPVFGRKGSSVHVQEIIRALRDQDAQIELFATALGGSPPADLESVPVHRLVAIPKGAAAVRERAAMAANRELGATLSNRGRFDLIYERYSLWSFAGMESARSMDAPGVLEVNSPLIEEQRRYRTLVHGRDAQQIAERTFENATLIVAVSQGVAEYLAQIPEARGRVQVIPNGVNPRRFDVSPRTVRAAADHTFTVGFVGTLKPWHGLRVLMEAFAELRKRDPAIRLLVVGAGPERENLEAELESRGLLNSAHFTGGVDPCEVPGLLSSMDVGVLPGTKSEEYYFSPLKVYEYMCAGLPVVAGRVGQLETIIEDEINGLLCTVGDVSEFAKALWRLRCDTALRTRLGQAARQTVLQQHTWDAAGRRILRLAGLGPEARIHSLPGRA